MALGRVLLSHLPQEPGICRRVQVRAEASSSRVKSTGAWSFECRPSHRIICRRNLIETGVRGASAFKVGSFLIQDSRSWNTILGLRGGHVEETTLACETVVGKLVVFETSIRHAFFVRASKRVGTFLIPGAGFLC